MDRGAGRQSARRYARRDHGLDDVRAAGPGPGRAGPGRQEARLLRRLRHPGRGQVGPHGDGLGRRQPGVPVLPQRPQEQLRPRRHPVHPAHADGGRVRRAVPAPRQPVVPRLHHGALRVPFDGGQPIQGRDSDAHPVGAPAHHEQVQLQVRPPGDPRQATQGRLDLASHVADAPEGRVRRLAPQRRDRPHGEQGQRQPQGRAGQPPRHPAGGLHAALRPRLEPEPLGHGALREARQQRDAGRRLPRLLHGVGPERLPLLPGRREVRRAALPRGRLLEAGPVPGRQHLEGRREDGALRPGLLHHPERGRGRHLLRRQPQERALPAALRPGHRPRHEDLLAEQGPVAQDLERRELCAAGRLRPRLRPLSLSTPTGTPVPLPCPALAGRQQQSTQ